MTTAAEVLSALRHEHAELLPHVEGFRVAAEAVDLPSARDAFELVDEAYRFLTEHLLVHAHAEEESLYAAFTQVVGSPEAARIMTLDHEVIGGMAKELTALRRALADHDTMGKELRTDLRRVLYGLYALVPAHFEKEEHILVPLLEQRLSPVDAERVMHVMRQKAHAHTHTH